MRAASRRSCGTRDEGLVQAERHVPGLRGEDREDRRAFVAQEAAGKERDEAGDGDRQEAQDRHRLQNVEDRDEELLGAPALRGGGGIDEAEDERGRERQHHAHHRPEPVFRQHPRIERDRQRFAGTIGHVHLLARPGDQHDRADDKRQRHAVPVVGLEARRPGDERHSPALLHDPASAFLSAAARV